VLTYPTDLTAQERELAQARLRKLAEEFTANGTLRTPRWREVFQRTWRHPYVPAYYPSLGTPALTAIDPQRRDEWLDVVYSNETLITKVVWLPMVRELRPGAFPMWTSSSTLPSLVLNMLEALQVQDGQRVLEIGTGSGYSTALLCERLGSQYVTSVDIDPELVDLARERLAAHGYKPTLKAVDGTDGYRPGAPYDRIIATCAVTAIPPAWLAQASPGAVILADVRGPIGGTLARLTVDTNGTATGRFLPICASFMWLRHTPDIAAPTPPPWLDSEPSESVSEIDSDLIRSNGQFAFLLQWHLPGVTWGPIIENGQPGVQLTAPDGSHVMVSGRRTGGSTVTQVGHTRLWDRVEHAHDLWQRVGQPTYERFGITATATDQFVWLDNPDSEHRWQLPLTELPGSRT